MQTPLQIAISAAVKIALVVVLWGVVRQGRYRLSYAFPVYLVAVLGCGMLIAVWPQRFYTMWFWIVQQTVWDVAKLVLGVELTYRAFRAFPGARPVAYTSLTSALGLSTLGILATPLDQRFAYEAAIFEWHPRVLTATIWLMTGLAFLVVWYRIPIHDFQRAILLGFVPYLVVFTTLLNLLRDHGWGFRVWHGYLDSTAYLALTLWWAYAAWREDEPLDISPEVARRLQVEA